MPSRFHGLKIKPKEVKILTEEEKEALALELKEREKQLYDKLTEALNQMSDE